ncbi:N(6)-adenine-specific methyltransferase METTL4 [Megalobrama amblycephala]|uniref:N(6)-adenine-specific methyltransferase METTL4 n=1 Tax=Megalobrama amblycephala TaxID=75352 RepID=UPI0020142F1A|nr:N(6)-adenine-specific methyltransferase METTL4 [Megalobrama amblycephala]XP_048041269.1 N(6)-adenine-specific methyltransferase METTL4 [Megalobrama amblycephala]XP_048041270.1 N(6)-adenine-specific methyltransferase METTL4 [Megalobrama amblycephala]
MSIVCGNSWGWLLDSCTHIDEGLQRCVCQSAGLEKPTYFKYCFKREYFNTLKPHGQIQQNTDILTSYTAKHSNGEHAKTDLQTRKKRKRKQRDLNTGELDAHIYHGKIRSVVLEGSQALLEAARQCGYLTKALTTPPSESLTTHECQLAALCDMAKQLPLTDESEVAPVQTLNGDGLDPPLDIFSYVTENPFDSACEVTLMREKYLLPPRSRFLLSDITRMHPLVNSGDKFDLIVLDPPWENKSVKRSNRYSSLPSSQLKQLPVPALAAPECLVVTWVTNRAKHLRFVKEELYPYWAVEVVAEWLWVKVTRTGEFVFPLDSQHKKPYEVLVLGKYRSSIDHAVRSSAVDELPEQRLLISVPSVLHSHKPLLSAVLKPYISHKPKCLELFARSLQCDWTSWGNEVIKFQHSSYFTRERAEDPARTSETALTQ